MHKKFPAAAIAKPNAQARLFEWQQPAACYNMPSDIVKRLADRAAKRRPSALGRRNWLPGI